MTRVFHSDSVANLVNLLGRSRELRSRKAGGYLFHKPELERTAPAIRFHVQGLAGRDRSKFPVLAKPVSDTDSVADSIHALILVVKARGCVVVVVDVVVVIVVAVASVVIVIVIFVVIVGDGGNRKGRRAVGSVAGAIVARGFLQFLDVVQQIYQVLGPTTTTNESVE
jgi:ABC-type multidrug transport system fused ATPase/permease subunit